MSHGARGQNGAHHGGGTGIVFQIDKLLVVSEIIDEFQLICGLSDSGRIVDAVLTGDENLTALLRVRQRQPSFRIGG